MSELDETVAEMLAAIANNYGADPEVSHLTHSVPQLVGAWYAATVGGASPHLSMSVPAMLAAIRNDIVGGAEKSHLSALVGELLADVATEVGDGTVYSRLSSSVAALLSPVRRGGAWTQTQLDAFMYGQTDGLSYNVTKTDRFFQENTGVTLADDVGEAIGLALGDRLWNGSTLAQVIAAAPELRASGAGSASGGWTESGGVVTAPGTSGADNVSFSLTTPTVAGRRYEVTIPNTMGASSFYVDFGGGTGSQIGSLSSSTSRIILTCTAPGSVVRVGRWSGSPTGTIGPISVKEIPGRHGVQASGPLKPVRQTTGAKFDAADDFWLTNYTASATNNFIVALVTVPSSLAAAQRFVGTSGASDGRLRLGFSTSGYTCAAVGADLEATITGAADRRNTEVVVGLSCNGSTVRLFDDDAMAYEAAQNGAPNTTVPLMVGATNGNGTSANFFGGSVKKLLVGREFIDLTKYRQIRSALLAA